MLTCFYKDSWSSYQESDYFRRVLKTLRYHNSIARIDKPTTQLVFFSSPEDAPIRHYFEESSRHFKTYNTSYKLFELFSHKDNDSFVKNGRYYPLWFLSFLYKVTMIPIVGKIISSLLPSQVRLHFHYRTKLHSLTVNDFMELILPSFKTMGITEFSKLNVLICQSFHLNYLYGMKFICDMCKREDVREAFILNGFRFADEAIFFFGVFNKKRSSFKFYQQAKEDSVKLQEYFFRKVDFVQSRIGTLKFNQETLLTKGFVFVAGRRHLTRGSTLNKPEVFLQSYDFQEDPSMCHLQKLILQQLPVILSQSHEEILVVIEHNPTMVLEVINRSSELKDFLKWPNIAIACIEPESKIIYALEGTEFVQQFLKQVY